MCRTFLYSRNGCTCVKSRTQNFVEKLPQNTYLKIFHVLAAPLIFEKVSSVIRCVLQEFGTSSKTPGQMCSMQVSENFIQDARWYWAGRGHMHSHLGDGRESLDRGSPQFKIDETCALLPRRKKKCREARFSRQAQHAVEHRRLTSAQRNKDCS